MNRKRTPHNKSHRLGASCALLVSLGICIPTGYAQEAQGTDPSNDVFELSPFEVSGDSEIGYLATETLSGTRMRSQMGDVAASIDVLTEEFLRDVGATGMYEALDFVGNIETFDKSGGLSEAENTVFFSNPYMARGFATSALTADFFDWSKPPLDFYNRTNFTVARGPNAILFGIGSPGGIVNSARKRPLFGKDANELQLMVDNYGSFRSTLDFSREIVDRKLAVRAAFLYDDRKEFLKPAAYLRRAGYGSVTYRPFKKTSITATYENGNEDRTFRYTTTMYDGITPWINAGQPVFDGTPNNPPINQALGSGLDRERAMGLVISGQPQIPVLNWLNMARTERFEIAGHPSINSIRTTGYTEDTAIWDYEDIQLVGDSRRRKLDWDDFALFITQELFVPQLQLELAYNKHNTDYRLAQTFGQFYLQMDANKKLPNGDPNPYFGVPYVENDRNEVVGEINGIETARATLSYDLDLNDHEIFGIGLGRYNFMGLYEDNRSDSVFASYRRGWVQNDLGFPATNYFATQNSVRTRTYVETALTPDGVAVEPYHKVDWTPVDRDGMQDAWFQHTSPRDIEDTRESYVLALQAFLWRAKEDFDRLILTVGYREDRQTSQRKEYVRTNQGYEGSLWRGSPWEMDSEKSALFWDGQKNYGTWGEKSSTKSPTKTYSAIFKATKDLSFFYNFSDVVISASSLFTDIYDNFVDGTVGETEDYGIRWNGFDGKLVASLTVFETSAQNQRESNVRTIFTPELEDIWAAVDPNGAIHTGFNERYVTLRDDTSKGVEFTVVANLKPGWSTRLSISTIETIIQTRLPIVDRYIAEFSPLWESNRTLSLSEADLVDPDYLTVGDALDSLYQEIGDLHALEGTVPSAQRDTKIVLNSNYTIRDGALAGFSFGGGVRWQSKDIVGYAYDENFIVDPDRPFYGEELLDVTANLSYTTTIKGVWMRFQLNVSNLLDKDGTFARSAVDDLMGNPVYGRQQVREPRSFRFTTTFRF